jgi:hypothetical protein
MQSKTGTDTKKKAMQSKIINLFFKVSIERATETRIISRLDGKTKK